MQRTVAKISLWKKLVKRASAAMLVLCFTHPHTKRHPSFNCRASIHSFIHHPKASVSFRRTNKLLSLLSCSLMTGSVHFHIITRLFSPHFPLKRAEREGSKELKGSAACVIQEITDWQMKLFQPFTSCPTFLLLLWRYNFPLKYLIFDSKQQTALAGEFSWRAYRLHGLEGGEISLVFDLLTSFGKFVFGEEAAARFRQSPREQSHHIMWQKKLSFNRRRSDDVTSRRQPWQLFVLLFINSHQQFNWINKRSKHNRVESFTRWKISDASTLFRAR